MAASTADHSGKENPFMFSVCAIYIIFTFIVVSVPKAICFKTAKQKESVLFFSR